MSSTTTSGAHLRQAAAALDAEMRKRILDLAEQFPRIWSDARIDVRERKRILRLLIVDLTLIKSDKIMVHVRLSGGATRTLTLDRPLPIAQIRKFKPELIAEVDRLLDRHCDREIAEIFNARGLRTWEGSPYNLKKIAHIRTAYSLPSRRQRLLNQGMLTTEQVAARFNIAPSTVHEWGRQGLIKSASATITIAAFGNFPLTILSSEGAPDAMLIQPASRP